jgi:Flp pilus assembly protein TadG
MPPTAQRVLRARIRALVANGDRGSSTTEMALTTPLLVAILLFVVLCGRLVSAQMDLDAAASSAARAASLARTEPTARADRTARDILTTRRVTCQQVDVTVTGNLRPGGAVTVRVSCTVPMSDLTLLGVPGSRALESTATSPIDRWRGST